MKLIFMSGVLLMLISCSTVREFKYSDGPDAGDKTIVEKLDPNDYTIYLRQVCTSDDKAKNIYLDCPLAQGHDNLKKLEIEYLFISKKDDRVFYITNFPDKYEYIYNTPGFSFSDKVNVNVWYLSKLFVGTIERAKGTITFKRNEKKSMIIEFDMPSQNQVRFSSLDEKKQDHSRIRKMTALNPSPSFFAYPDFQFMFTKYKSPPLEQENAVPVTDNAIIFVKGKGVYFGLAQKWDNKDKRWIKYKYGRLATRNF